MTTRALTTDERERLAALTKCASDNNARPVIKCIQFTEDRAYATDSYVLSWMDWADGPDESVLVPARALHLILRRTPKRASLECNFGTDGMRLRSTRTDLLSEATTEHRIDYYDREYPDIEKFIPDPEDVSQTGLDDRCGVSVKRLAQVAGVSDFDMDGHTPVRLLQEDTHDPVVVEVAGVWAGLVMPMRDVRRRGDREEVSL